MKSFGLVLIAFLALIQVSLCGTCPYLWEFYQGEGDSPEMCLKEKTYKVTTGYNWKHGDDQTLEGAKKRCNNDNPQGCEQWASAIYPKCAVGFTKSSCCNCTFDHCPSGTKFLLYFRDSRTNLMSVGCEQI